MASANFEACLAHVLRQEGGYVDNKSDPGGATNMGITRKTLARWRHVTPWMNLPKSDVQALQQVEAAAIYRALYWNRCDANNLATGLDLALFDFAVNSGPQRAISTLQALVNVRRDGVIGPITRNAIKAYAAQNGMRALIGKLCQARLGFLTRLTTFSVFGRGWRNRVADIQKAALVLAGNPDPVANTKGDDNMSIFTGYKTYIVGAMMVLTAIAQIAGIDVPGFGDQSVTQLLMEGFAIVFLRKGLKSDIGNS